MTCSPDVCELWESEEGAGPGQRSDLEERVVAELGDADRRRRQQKARVGDFFHGLADGEHHGRVHKRHDNVGIVGVCGLGGTRP